MIKQSVSLPAPMLQRLREESEKRGRTVSDIVRRAVDEFLERLDAQGQKPKGQ